MNEHDNNHNPHPDAYTNGDSHAHADAHADHQQDPAGRGCLHRRGGAGYKEGFVFVIKDITHSIPFDILWGGVYDGGVYSFAVKPFAEYGGILTKEEIGIIEKLNKS